MQKQVEQIKQFEDFFEVPSYPVTSETMRVSEEGQKITDLRTKLALEELAEVAMALGNEGTFIAQMEAQAIKLREKGMAKGKDTRIIHSRTNLLKELADVEYINIGTARAFRLDDKLEGGFDITHESNLSKLEDGRPVKREDGKVVKGKNYKEADLTVLFT